jgi:SAM-dependent methyltransferase
MSEEIVIRGETSKVRARRLATGWFDKYMPENAESGLDVGCQHDRIHETPNWRPWDVIFGDGDATYLEGVPDGSISHLYASHVLEHLKDPITAVRNWWRVLKPNGLMCVSVPSRDHYERKKELPSVWNIEHAFFYVENDDEPPCTKGLRATIARAIPDAEEVFFELDIEGWYPPAKGQHSPGNYSLTIVLRKT